MLKAIPKYAASSKVEGSLLAKYRSRASDVMTDCPVTCLYILSIREGPEIALFPEPMILPILSVKSSLDRRRGVIAPVTGFLTCKSIGYCER